MKTILAFSIFTCLLFVNTAYAQLTCGTSISTLTNSQLGDITSNVSSYTYAAGVYNMPYNVFIAKTAGNGPNLYPYGSSSVWVGKDNNVNLDSVVIEITFTSNVLGVTLDFGAINNNSDGEEQIQRIYPKLSSGQLLTSGVTYVYEPGVPSGTVSGTYFVNTNKTIRAYSGNADDGRLTITATTPFRKIRFTQKEISSLSLSGPNGILIKRISYCPVIPDIAVSRNNLNIAMNGTVSYGTTGYGSPISRTIQISNQGTANLNLSSLSLQNGTHWNIMNTISNVVAPNDTVFLTVDFNPLVSGPLTDQLQIVSNDWNEVTYLVNLTGSGLTANLLVQHQNNVVPENGTINLPSTYVGLSVLDSIYIQNTGVDNLVLSGISFSNGAFSSQNSGNFTLAPGSGSWYVYQFTPSVVGLQTATLIAQSNDPSSPYVIQIQGIGIAPVNVQLSACENQFPYFYQGNTYSNSGNYNEIVTGTNGQDSLTILTLSSLLIDSTQSTVNYCSTGTPFNWNGQMLTSTGTYEATLTATNGCDSVATLFFTVQTGLQNTVNVMVCQEDFPFIYAGQQINSAGNYIFHNPTQNGCDSVVNYSVNVYPTMSSSQSLTVCENDYPILWNGISISQMGAYSITTSSVVTGCDSTADINVITLQTDTVHQSITLQSNALPYMWNGQVINAAGTYTSIQQNIIGCDSVIFLHLNVNIPTIPNLNVLYEGTQENNPATHTLPNIPIQSSVIKNITLQNTGNQNLLISAIQLSGGGAILLNSNILSVPIGGSVTFQVKFQPITIGAKVNVLSIYSNDLNHPQFVINFNYNAINGAVPDIRCLYSNNPLTNGANLDLPVNIPSGTPYPFLFELKNSGQANLLISSITCTNGIVNTNYNNQMVSNESQFIAVTLNPVGSGFKTFNIVVNSNDASDPAFLIVVRVNVTVPVLLQPEIQILQATDNIVSQSTLNFNATSIGQFSSLVLQIKNIGSANLNLTNIQFSNSLFSLIGTLPSLLAPNQSVNVTIRFTPTQIGNESCNLTISNNDANENPFVIYLTGSALLPTLENCNSCNSLKVNSNPKHNSEWVDVMTTFEWQHEEGLDIAYYQVIVTKANSNGDYVIPVVINGNFTNTVNQPTTSVNAKLQMSNTLSYNSKYKWSVTAYNSSGLPISCFKRIFKTIPVPNVIQPTCSHPSGVALFGTKIGAVSNVPIYKNGGCENGAYNKFSTTIPSQSGWSYGWQCVELPSRYYKTKYLINCSGGNGKDYFDVHVQGNRKGFRQLVNNLTNSAPKPDDIITFMRADPNSAGHVALVHKFTPTFSQNTQNYTLKIFQENWGSNISQHLSYNLSLKFINGKWKATSSNYPTTRGWVRAKPEIISPGANNSIPTIVTTTPTFTWAKHNNIKGYKVRVYRLVGSCYQQVGDPVQIVGNQFNGQGFPSLVPGATYKWTVENIYFNNGSTYFAGTSIPSSASKTILSDNYYFKVANSAVPTNPQGNVNIAGGNLSQIFIQTIASPVNGSKILYKNDDDWLHLESTSGNGTANILQEFTPISGDSMRIERVGYLPLQFQVTNRMLNEKMLIPMLESKPSIIFRVEHLPQSNVNNASLKITGKNFTGYKIAIEGDFLTPAFTHWDSIQNIDLQDGMNYFEFMVYNDHDTVLISDRWLNINQAEEKLNILFFAQNKAAYDVYVDGDLFQSGKSEGVLSLPVSSYDVTFHAFGYAPLRYNISSDTILTLEPEKSSIDLIDTLVTNQYARGHYLGGNVSIDLVNNTLMHVQKTEAMSDSLYEIWGETLELSNNQSDYSVSWILDHPNLPENFLVKVVTDGNAVYLNSNQFGDSIVFERDYQVLKLLGWKNAAAITLVFENLENTNSELEDFVLFPNPNSDATVYIYLKDLSEGQTLKIYDLKGSIVKTISLEENGKDVSNVDISLLSKGIYYFEVNVDGKRRVKSFVRI